MASTKIRGVTIQLGADTTGLKTALKSVNTSIKTTQTQLNDVNRLLKLDPTNTELLAQKQRMLGTQIADTKKKLETLQATQSEVGAITEESSAEQIAAYDAIQREIIQTQTSLETLEAEYATVGATATAEMGTVAAETEAAAAASTEEAVASADKWAETGDKVSEVGEKMSVVSAAVAGLGVAAVYTAADFESAMDKVAALSGASGDELAELEAKAREMGASTKFSATESAEAFQYMALAGWDTGEMLEGIEPILKLATAADMDLGEASDIVTDYLTAFGLTAQDASGFVDQMAYAMANSNTDVTQLGEAYKNCAATAGSMGYSVEDVTATLMTMADAGLKGGEAGTALNAIMTRLATDTKGCASELAEYGVQVYDSEGNMNSLSEILQGTQSVWASLTDEQQANLAKSIAGTNHYSALQTIMAGLTTTNGETSSSFQQNAEALGECAGAATEMADIMQDNLEGQLTTLKSSLQELAISFGQMLLPMVKDVVDKLQGFADKLNSLSDDQKQMILTIAEVIAVVGPALIVVGKIITVISNIRKAMMLLNVVMSPELLIIAAIAAAVVAVILVIKNWGKIVEWFKGVFQKAFQVIQTVIQGFQTFFQTAFQVFQTIIQGFQTFCSTVWNGIKTVFETVWNAIFNNPIVQTIVTTLTTLWQGFSDTWSGVWDGIKEVVSAIWEIIKNVIMGPVLIIIDLLTGNFGQLGEDLSGIWNNIKDAASEIWQGLCDIVSSLITGLQEAITTIFTGIKDVATQVWTDLKDFVVNAVQTLHDKVVEIITAVQTTVQEIWDGITEWFTELPQKIEDGFSAVVDFFTNLPEEAWEWGSDMIQGFIDGIEDMIDNIGDAVTGIGDRIRENLHFSRPDKGPLRDYETWMPDFMQGLAAGIKNNSHYVTDAMSALTAGMTLDASGALVGAGSSGSSSTTNNYGATSINVYGSQGQDVESLARIIEQKMAVNVNRRNR